MKCGERDSYQSSSVSSGCGQPVSLTRSQVCSCPDSLCLCPVSSSCTFVLSPLARGMAAGEYTDWKGPLSFTSSRGPEAGWGPRLGSLPTTAWRGGRVFLVGPPFLLLGNPETDWPLPRSKLSVQRAEELPWRSVTSPSQVTPDSSSSQKEPLRFLLPTFSHVCLPESLLPLELA